MASETDQRLRAVAFMHAALELLDLAGEHAAAVYLQHAISVAGREPPPTRAASTRADDARF